MFVFVLARVNHVICIDPDLLILVDDVRGMLVNARRASD